jgi:hypothetical protein
LDTEVVRVPKVPGVPGFLSALVVSAITLDLPHAPALGFHHLHLNGTGQQEFYARLFDPATTSRSDVAGFAALRAGPMLMLFGQPQSPTERTPVVTPGLSAIWHFGWGTVSLGETYLQHAAREVDWDPPLPAGQLHLHIVSKAPANTAAWYRDRLGARVEILASAADPARAPAPRAEQRVAEALIYFGDFAMLVYRTNEPLVSTRGQRVDHIALIAPDARFGDSPARMLTGPDNIAIELIGAFPTVPDRD